MDAERGFATVNGSSLYYEVAGVGAPVVLVHGFTLDTRMWDDQFATLAEHYRVVRYDARGFGRSDMPTAESYGHHDDLAALLDRLAIDAAAVIGLSMGGGIAANFALAYPEQTRALVLIDAAFGAFRWSKEWTELMRPISLGAREQGMAVGKARWLAHPLFAPANEQPAVGARLAAMVGGYSGWHWLNRDPRREVEPAAHECLGAIAAPILAIIGERDLPDFHAMVALLREQAPQARIETFPGIGHMANMEAPEATNAALLAFLADVL